MAQAGRTPHLITQYALQWALGLEPSTVIINAALTFAAPKNCSSSKKTRHVKVHLNQGKRSALTSTGLFSEASASRFQTDFLWLVLVQSCSVISLPWETAPCEAFLALSPQSVSVAMVLPRPVVLLQSARSLSSFLMHYNLPWHISPSTFLEVSVILC